MCRTVQATVIALAVLTLVSARAEAPVRPEHSGVAAVAACLEQQERRAAYDSGKVIQLEAAIRAANIRVPGAIVRARLCHGQEGLVYVLTVLARDGRVARLTVDAAKGAVIGER